MPPTATTATLIIPAATAYDLLGNIKSLLRNVGEVTDYMPSGLAASLNDPRIEVYDRNHFTGEEREPAKQIALATAELRALTAALAAAAALAEAAQSTLNSQGYDEASGDTVDLPGGIPASFIKEPWG